MLQYQREFLATVKADIQPLLKQDWDEIQHNKDKIPLAPNWDLYQAVETMNTLRIFTARNNAGKLVGYMAFVITPSLHSKDRVMAVCDILFLDKTHRKGTAGVRLIRFAEESLIGEGLTWLQITTTESHPIDSLMKRLGYRKTETVFAKVI